MTLERVLEPEVMDSREEAEDYDTMDHSQVNRVFVDDMLAFVDAPSLEEAVLLDLGTGTAQIPVELCRRQIVARVLAVDLSAAMLDLARYRVEAESLIDQIELRQEDAKSLSLDSRLFQGVFSNSIVHHIPEPLAALREASRVVKPGGWLFFRDLMRPETDADVQQLVATYAGEASERQQKLFDESLRAALTVSEMRALVGQLGFAPESVQATSDRHWTWSARALETDD